MSRERKEKPISVAAALDQYYREHITIKAVARDRVEFALSALNSFFGVDGPALLKDVDIPACREYRVFRSDVSDATVRRELGVLQAAANHALRWRRITLDKMPSIEMPPASKSKPLWLFKDELANLLGVASETDRRVFRFLQIAYHTGSRKRAVETLPWTRVDLEAKRIDLQDSAAPVTKKRRPIVPISEAMTLELAELKVTASTRFVLETDYDIRPVFDRVALAAGLAELTERGLRPFGRLTPHVLRHSRATHLLQDGKSPFAVANLLGDTVETVLKVYGHACPDYMAEALA